MATADRREIGSTAIRQWGGRVFDEWHKDLIGPKAMKLYREMVDNSGVYGGWFALLEMLIRQGRPRVDKGRDTASAELERVKIEQSLGDMATPIYVVAGEIALGPVFGFVPWEKIFKIRRGPNEADPMLRSKYSDGRIGWFDWGLRPPESLSRWEFDERGRWTAMIQHDQNYRELPIPREKLIHFTPRPWKRSPEGRSFLRSSTIAYRMAKGHAEQEGICGWRNAAGLPFMTFPPNSWDEESTDPDTMRAVALRKEMMKELGLVRNGEFGALGVPAKVDRNNQPTGHELGQLEGPRTMFPYDSTIKRWDSRGLIALLCEHVLFGIDKQLNLAIRDTGTDFFALALGAILGGWCEEITLAASELSTFNGISPEDHVVIRHDDIEAPKLAEMATFVSTILGVEPSRLNDLMRRHLETWGQLPNGAFGEQPQESSVTLNGAQLDTQLKLMELVGTGAIERDAAIAFLMVNFAMSRENAESIIPEEPEEPIEEPIEEPVDDAPIEEPDNEPIEEPIEEEETDG